MLSRICSPRGWQSVTTHRVRFYHVISRNRPFAATIHKRTPVYVGCYRQYSSRESAGGADVSNDAELFRPTPTYDIPSDSTIDVTQSADSITSQTENLTTAASSGLGGYTPSGLLQTALDLLHTHSHLPWWATIAATTVAIRLMLVPMAVQLHINAIKIANINPIAMEINKKMVEYRAKGNTIGMAMEGKKLTELYAKHDCSPFKSFLMPLVQMPIFMSFFFALRQMASLPLESMKTGGMFWFTDLTVPDPYFALPLIACASFISNIEVSCSVMHFPVYLSVRMPYLVYLAWC